MVASTILSLEVYRPVLSRQIFQLLYYLRIESLIRYQLLGVEVRWRSTFFIFRWVKEYILALLQCYVSALCSLPPFMKMLIADVIAFRDPLRIHQILARGGYCDKAASLDCWQADAIFWENETFHLVASRTANCLDNCGQTFVGI